MKKVIGICSIAVFAFALAAAGAGKKLTGEISDKMCGKKHMMEGGDEKCTLACVDKGSKFVFVEGDKVLDIENQDAKGLRENAGRKVTVSAEVSKDGKSIKISDLKPAK
jgi:hypothetical protein